MCKLHTHDQEQMEREIVEKKKNKINHKKNNYLIKKERNSIQKRRNHQHIICFFFLLRVGLSAVDMSFESKRNLKKSVYKIPRGIFKMSKNTKPRWKRGELYNESYKTIEISQEGK